MPRIQIYFSDKEEAELLKEIDAVAENNYMSRSRFFKMASRVYIKYLKEKDL